MENDKTKKPALSKTAVSGSVTASELRIGNLLTDEFYDSFKTIIEVESIDKKGINLEIMDDGNYPECASRWIAPYYYFDYLRPIPITSEWLEKLGGVLKRHSINDYYLFDNNICIKKNLFVEGWSVKMFGEKHITSVIYIHQLQNLYFSLTSKELNNG